MKICTNSGPFKEELRHTMRAQLLRKKAWRKENTADEQYTPTITINLQVLDLNVQEREPK